MVTALAQPGPHPAPVVVVDDAVYVDGFVETAPDVVRMVGGADDPAAAVHRCLELGAGVLRLAGVSADAEMVRAEFGRLSGTFDASVDAAVREISDAASGLLDAETGALPGALAGFRAEVEQLLGETFDPDRRTSVVAKLEEVHRRAAEEQLRGFRRLINPDAEDSPLGRWRDEIVRTLKEQSGGILAELRALAEKVAVETAADAARTEALERSAAKGFTFEELLHGLVEPVATGHGDVAEPCGDRTGARGSKKGDEVVTLNPEDTRGLPAAFVLEVKDRKLALRNILDELDLAMANREAAAGIAVFSSQANAPVSVPFAPYGEKAVLVVDKADPDPTAVRLAYLWARWVVRRSLAVTADGVDVARVESLVEEARRALGRATTIRRAHSTARKKIEEAGGEVDALAAEVGDVLDAICAELAAVDAGSR